LQSVNISSHVRAGKNPSPRFHRSSSAGQTISQPSITSGARVYSYELSQVQPALSDIIFPKVLETSASEEEFWMCHDSKFQESTSGMALQFQ